MVSAFGRKTMNATQPSLYATYENGPLCNQCRAENLCGGVHRYMLVSYKYIDHFIHFTEIENYIVYGHAFTTGKVSLQKLCGMTGAMTLPITMSVLCISITAYARLHYTVHTHTAQMWNEFIKFWYFQLFCALETIRPFARSCIVYGHTDTATHTHREQHTRNLIRQVLHFCC